MTKNKQPTLSASIRSAVASSGLSHAEIARTAGTSQRAVSEFLSGRGCNSRTLDSLAKLAGVSVVLQKSKKSSEIG